MSSVTPPKTAEPDAAREGGGAAPEPTKRVRMSAAERREQILAVAKQVADAEGFHEISLERIAREAGITRPIVYQHFGDLNGLLAALVEHEGELALAQLDAVTPQGPIGDGDPVDVLVEALRGYLEVVRAEPARWRLVLMPPEGAPEVLREGIADGRARVVQQLAEFAAPVLTGGAGSGEDSDDGTSPDIELTAMTMSMISDDLARLVLTEPDRFPIDRLVDHTRWLLRRLT